MTVFADRRSFKQIGGLRAYLHQVSWSIWWRFHVRSISRAAPCRDSLAEPLRDAAPEPRVECRVPVATSAGVRAEPGAGGRGHVVR